MPLKDGDGVVNWGPLTMNISNLKQDIPQEYGGGLVNGGPLTMAIFKRMQDVPYEDEGRLVRWGPLTMAIFNGMQDVPQEDNGWGGPLQLFYDGYLQQEVRYATGRWEWVGPLGSSYHCCIEQEA